MIRAADRIDGVFSENALRMPSRSFNNISNRICDNRLLWSEESYLLVSIEMNQATSSSEVSPSVAEILEKCIGCKWTLHVLAQVRRGVCRPGQLERSADGLTAKVLNERLHKLLGFGILARTVFAEVPPRVEYQLTSFGERLLEVIDQLEALQRDFPGPHAVVDATNT